VSKKQYSIKLRFVGSAYVGAEHAYVIERSDILARSIVFRHNLSLRDMSSM